MNGEGGEKNLSASKDISGTACVSDIKWAVHSPGINTAVVLLSAPHHRCHSFKSFCLRQDLTIRLLSPQSDVAVY